MLFFKSSDFLNCFKIYIGFGSYAEKADNIFWTCKSKTGITVSLLTGIMNLIRSKELQQGFQILSDSGLSAAPTIVLVTVTGGKEKLLVFIKNIRI